jgi:hypothetical protein
MDKRYLVKRLRTVTIAVAIACGVTAAPAGYVPGLGAMALT